MVSSSIKLLRPSADLSIPHSRLPRPRSWIDQASTKADPRPRLLLPAGELPQVGRAGGDHRRWSDGLQGMESQEGSQEILSLCRVGRKTSGRCKYTKKFTRYSYCMR